MHTSTILTGRDFHYFDSVQQRAVSFADWCPDYSPHDRIGIVCPSPTAGAAGTARALLALATSFYDALRANGAPFFNYPQHYALLSTAHEYGTMDTKDLGAPWSALDVWPESQWIEVEANVSSMLSAACALHLSRLFWPEGFMPGKIAAPRPGYELKLLKNRLRSVWLYGSANPDIVVTGTEAVDKLVTQSITALPDKPRVATIEGHRRCAVDEFLAGMDGCFAS